ncbi:MAG: GDSL-type esterase/lipase family protein, partial [Desulfotignum sp.]
MKIICHGDSLTQGSDMAKPCTWTALLENRLNIPVVNTGISGDTTAGMLARFAVDVVPRKPGIVILMGGTNDLWYDNGGPCSRWVSLPGIRVGTGNAGIIHTGWPIFSTSLAYLMLFLQAAISFSRAISRGSSPMSHSISKVMRSVGDWPQMVRYVLKQSISPSPRAT